jgi:hypothetical protein
VSPKAVAEYLARADRAGITWPLPEGMTGTELERRLFPSPVLAALAATRPLPDCEYIYSELRRWRSKVNLTIIQLWIEYKEQHANGCTPWMAPFRLWTAGHSYAP